ncbi:hypothetical protein AOQ84DRAFT_224794, partial [Glonium stellatum]
ESKRKRNFVRLTTLSLSRAEETGGKRRGEAPKAGSNRQTRKLRETGWDGSFNLGLYDKRELAHQHTSSTKASAAGEMTTSVTATASGKRRTISQRSGIRPVFDWQSEFGLRKKLKEPEIGTVGMGFGHGAPEGDDCENDYDNDGDNDGLRDNGGNVHCKI